MSLTSKVVTISRHIMEMERNFPGATGDFSGLMSDMTLAAAIRRLNAVEQPIWVDGSGVPVVPHGFRSSFRDWAADCRSEPREVVETALAHTVGNAVERSYRRSDLFDRRVALMNGWGAFCAGRAGGNVTSLRHSVISAQASAQ